MNFEMFSDDRSNQLKTTASSTALGRILEANSFFYISVPYV
jgi:hypothetical protein